MELAIELAIELATEPVIDALSRDPVEMGVSPAGIDRTPETEASELGMVVITISETEIGVSPAGMLITSSVVAPADVSLSCRGL